MYIRVTTPHLQHLSESSVQVREVVGRMEEKDMDLMSRFFATNPNMLVLLSALEALYLVA
jgi:hypothetical protein